MPQPAAMIRRSRSGTWTLPTRNEACKRRGTAMSDTRRWYHVVATTYGAWLDGDPRGFRTRHHREHVEGDYRNPPPAGTYAAAEARSGELMPQDAVVLPEEMQAVVGEAILKRLTELGALIACLAKAGQHVHILAKMPYGKPRVWVGLAKRHVWFVLREKGWKGKLWGKRCKPTPVRTRVHQLNAFRYIVRHGAQGAWVWRCNARR